jgi:hypothetical protein
LDTLVGNASFLISVWLVFDLPHFANLVHSADMERDHPRDFACPALSGTL